MTTSNRRLIEVAFPLKQTSIDSIQEKNVHNGHISTLHFWPARRPLVACESTLVITLMPGSGDKETINLINHDSDLGSIFDPNYI